jgi:hypothetical protein
MFFHYHAKVINAERVGGRIVRVQCTRCGCEYFFQFTRIGVGKSEAPYGLGVDRATRKANERAQKDLDRRLASEAELVPCPKCNWINEELIAGYRRGSYYKLGYAARLIAVFGVVIGVVIEAILGVLEPGLLVYFLLVPASVFLLSGGVLVLRQWLRGRIQPNADHPLPPKLPPGSPPALLKDPESGQLVLAKPLQPPVDASQDWCDFQVGRHRWPALCCGCLQPTTLDRGHPMKVTTTMRLVIPRCADCATATRHHFRRLLWNGTIVGVGVTALIVLPLNLDWLMFGLASVGLLILAIVVTVFVARDMTAPARIAGGDRSRGVVRLRFRNGEYARAVAEHLGA